MCWPWLPPCGRPDATAGAYNRGGRWALGLLLAGGWLARVCTARHTCSVSNPRREATCNAALPLPAPAGTIKMNLRMQKNKHQKKSCKQQAASSPDLNLSFSDTHIFSLISLSAGRLTSTTESVKVCEPYTPATQPTRDKVAARRGD